MANPLKEGPDVTSGTGESSSNKGGPMIERPYGAQQRAIQDANHAQDQAAKAAGEAAFRQATGRPPQKQITSGNVSGAIDEFMGRTPPKPGSPTPTPTRSKPTARRGK